MNISDSRTYELQLGTRSDQVILGNKDRPDRYEAHVEFGAFDGEISLKIAYPDVFNTDSSLISDKMTIASGAESVNLYEVGDDGLEFEIVLASVPAKNVWTFNLSGHDDFNFSYQDTLENDWNNFAKDSGRFADLADYLDNTIRPDHIVGSYAVFHKSKSGHVIGQTDYGTGKLMHIYRPKAVDDLSREIWAELNIIDGAMTITVDRAWLDSALYPVTIDPYFGYNTVGGSQQSWGGYLPYMPGTSAAGAGNTLTSISVYCYSDADQDPMYTALYSDSTGPNAKLDESAGSGIPGDGVLNAAWVEVDMGDDYVLASSTAYWIAARTGEGTVWAIFYDSTEVEAEKAHLDYDADSFPATAADDADWAGQLSMRAEYTAGAAGNAPTGTIFGPLVGPLGGPV
jgi:hypothetical protein